MGLLGLSGSFAFFFAGDIGGDIMEPPPPDLTDDGSRFAIPCRSGIPALLGPPGENWSASSWLNTKQLFKKTHHDGGVTRYLPGEFKFLKSITQVWGSHSLGVVWGQADVP